MATLAYTPHLDDTFGFERQASHMHRRPSVHSSYGSPPHIPFPYSDQHAGMYTDRPMSAGLHAETYPEQSYEPYPIYSQPDRRSRHMSGFDEYAVHDSYYPDSRRGSVSSHHSALPQRRRRRSTTSVSFDMRAPPMDTLRRLSSKIIKFKRKGAYRSGLTIGDAQANARLSGNDSYTFRDFNADVKGRIALKIRWAGYPSLTYDVPLDGYGDRVNLQTLARRTARAIVHFLQTNIIPVPWNCVEMLRLEEVAPGTWQPILAVR